MGWQVYFVAGDKIVGCVGKSGFMTRILSNVGTFNNVRHCNVIAAQLLAGPHPLDHHGKVSASIKFHEPSK